MYYWLITVHESNDHESERTTLSTTRKRFEAENDFEAGMYYQQDVNESAGCDECNTAMGGGCFSFHTYVVGIKRKGERKWLATNWGPCRCVYKCQQCPDNKTAGFSFCMESAAWAKYHEQATRKQILEEDWAGFWKLIETGVADEWDLEWFEYRTNRRMRELYAE